MLNFSNIKSKLRINATFVTDNKLQMCHSKLNYIYDYRRTKVHMQSINASSIMAFKPKSK
jgi:hypothetical protein